MSAVFYRSDEQKKLALETMAAEEKKRGKKIHTEVVAFTKFYLAEDYHQKYYLRSSRELATEYLTIYPNSRDFANSTAVARVNAYLGGYGSKAQLEKEIGLLGLSEAGAKRLRAKVE